MNIEDGPRIGGNIKRIRRHKEVSQAVLANQIGLSQTAVSRIEKCQVDVNSNLAFKIADALGVPVEKLFEQPTNGTEA